MNTHNNTQINFKSTIPCPFPSRQDWCIITADLNKLNIYNLLNQLSFAQLVKSPTRGENILDVFITNVPHYWKKVKITNSLVRSDHKANYCVYERFHKRT